MLPGLLASSAFLSVLAALAVAGAAPKSAPTPPPDVDLAAAASAASAQGWIDLIGDPALTAWQRLPLPAGSALAPSTPWRFDTATRTLRYEGSGSHELLLHETPRGDGIFRVEWRFLGNPARPNATAWVRTTPDLATSHYAALAPPLLGSLSGLRTSADGRTQRINIGSRRPNLLRKADEWNVLELICVGSRLTLQCNGITTTTWNECSVPTGRLGLESDGTPVEFRVVRFRPLR